MPPPLDLLTQRGEGETGQEADAGFAKLTILNSGGHCLVKFIYKTHGIR